jgi:hypothetical protein
VNQLIEALLLGTHGIVAEGTAFAENVRRFGGERWYHRRIIKHGAQAIVATLRNRATGNTAEVRKRIFEHMSAEVGTQHYLL